MFNPPDIYNITCPSIEETYTNIARALGRGKRPDKKDIICYLRGWKDLDTCSRHKSNYFYQHFGHMECIGSGKAEKVLVVAIKGNPKNFGIHVLCDDCAERYIQSNEQKVKTISKYKKVTPRKEIYIYNVDELV